MVAAVSNTTYGIINDAMHDAGLLGTGDLPDSQSLSDNLRRLCDIINVAQVEGLKLFLLKDQSIPLVVSQSSYILGPGSTTGVDMTKPLQAIQGYVLLTEGDTRRPLNQLSWNEWMMLSQVTGNDSVISSFFVNKQATNLEIKVWPPPDAEEATNTLHLLIRQQAENPVNLEENVSFSQEWRIYLRWALAADISTGQPESIMNRCEGKAAYFKEILEGWDVEDTQTYFTPSSQVMQNTGKFTS